MEHELEGTGGYDDGAEAGPLASMISADDLSPTSRIQEPAGRSAHVRQGLHSCMTQLETMREMSVRCCRRFRAAAHRGLIGGRSDVVRRQIANHGRGPDVLGRQAPRGISVRGSDVVRRQTARGLSVRSMSECHNLQSGGPEAWHSGFYVRSVCSHLDQRIRPPCCFSDTQKYSREHSR